MRAFYPAVSAISFLLTQGAVIQGAVAGDPLVWSAGTLFNPVAQNTRLAPRVQPAPVTAQATPAPPQAPAADTQPAERTETTNFDNWILNCREFIEGPKKRNCAMTVAV